MNKLVTVLGVAAVATLAGCKDPQYKPMASRSQTQPKGVVITPDVQPAPAPVKTSCMCPPGAKHYTPCECGADDCACVVVAKPSPQRATPAPAVAPVAFKDFKVTDKGIEIKVPAMSIIAIAIK